MQKGSAGCCAGLDVRRAVGCKGQPFAPSLFLLWACSLAFGSIFCSTRFVASLLRWWPVASHGADQQALPRQFASIMAAKLKELQSQHQKIIDEISSIQSGTACALFFSSWLGCLSMHDLIQPCPSGLNWGYRAEKSKHVTTIDQLNTQLGENKLVAQVSHLTRQFGRIDGDGDPCPAPH